MLIVRIGRVLQSRLGLFVASVAGAWCFINAGLYLGFIGFGAQTGLTIPARLTLCTILLWIPVTEVSLLTFVMSGLKALRVGRPSARVLAVILIPVAITGTTSLLLAVIAGWALRGLGFSFPKFSIVRGLVVEVGSIAPWMMFKEVSALIWTLAVAVLVAASLVRITPAFSLEQSKKLLAFAVVNCLVLGMLVRAIPMQFSERERNRIDSLVKADFSPTSTLIWGKLLLPDHTDLGVDETLAPRRATASVETAGRRPNIILIAVESLRGGEESRISGGEYVMPTLNRLAKEGINFKRAYAPSNESAYSISAILTSQHMLKKPGRDDFRKPAVPYVRMYDLLPETYATGFFSASPEEWQNMRAVSWSPKLNRFFDASHAKAGVLNVPESDTGFSDAVRKGELRNGSLDDEFLVRAFDEWIDHLGPSASSKPFFAMFKFDASHFPYQQGFDVPVRFSPADLSPAELRSLTFFLYPRELAPRLQNRYWNSLSYDDGLIQRILEHLQRRKALEDTVVMVFGDHGELFYENGTATHADRLWEQTLHTAFVVWGAKNWAPSGYLEPVSLLDIAPMVLNLAGVAPYGGFQGRVPAALEPGGATVGAGPRPIFSVVQNVRFEESVLVGPWRYVLQSDGLYETLHDVLRDPFEAHDEMQSHPEVVECLYATIVEFRRNQLGYYNRSDLIQSYFPPRHRLADVPACAGLREGGR